MSTIIITESLDEPCAQWLAQRAKIVRCDHENTNELNHHLADADALIVRTYTKVNKQLLARAPRLKAVGRAGVGLENIDLEACRQHDVRVVYTPEANTQAVVEYVLALILDELRPRHALDEPIDDNTFHELRQRELGTQLDQVTLGILGFGRIGKRLGRVVHALGMKLLVNDLISESELRQAVDYPFRFVDIPVLYRESDVLTLHVDGRQANRRLIDAEALDQLKANCLLVNAARGMLIDTEALVRWASKSAAHGGRAVLDVHEPEPMPADYPLYAIPNIRLLPHLAARTHTAMQNMCWVVRDVMAVLQGERPKYPAN